MDANDDDEMPQLSAETLQALQQFYSEQEAVRDDANLEDNQAVDKGNPEIFAKDMNAVFPEDWQMSQFWYDDATSDFLANLVKSLVGPEGKIACLSCPSVFRACGLSNNVHLYEFDRRFSKFGNSYFFYDYNLPEDVPEESIRSYGVVIADPPFLSEECLQKLSATVKKLLLEPNGKIILCTGAVMEEKAAELLGLKKTSFTPKHKKNLGNTFACFANFDL